jgi:D-alanyl-D-alanine carboxypeptidase/D-alanyl-D-alanine-endopeptidase (penicillin-binding protein 4)
MCNRVIGLLLSAFLIGCTGSRELLQNPPPPASPLAALSRSSSPRLKTQIDAFLADSLFPPSNLGIKIVSLTRGEQLYSLNDNMLFNPASNEKLFTSATALHTLGTTFSFSTAVVVDSLRRLVILKGYGDPLTSTGDLDSLARRVAPRLSNAAPWRIAVDVSFFDDLPLGAGWTWDEEPSADGMFISPVTLNNNAISVRVLPSSKAGTPPLISIDPPTSYVTVENSATTVVDTPTVRLKVSRKWRERSNTITVEGQIRLGGRPRNEQLSLWKPELYAGTVFAERLQACGIPVAGTVAIDTVTPAMVEMERYTHGIDTVLTFLNKVSDNLSAECVLKTIAAEKLGVPGSAEAGITRVHAYLSECGVDTNRIAVADGSGLSRYNLTSAATIVRLLERVYRDNRSFPLLYHALPIAGIDGTIGSRMKGTVAAGNLRAKTGSLSGVSALSGYVCTLDGEMLAFSILMQNFPGATRPYRLVQDALGAYLAGLKRGEF